MRGALKVGDAPLALLGAIAFRTRQLLLVRWGANPKEAGMSPGQHRRLQVLAGAFHPGGLARCHDRAAELDLELTRPDLPDQLLLEVGVIELATSRQVGTPFNPLATT